MQGGAAGAIVLVSRYFLPGARERGGPFMRIGILTSGGDCPGLNAVIRSVVNRAVAGHGDEVIGFEDGFRGMVEHRSRPLDPGSVRGILPLGGSVLGSTRVEKSRLHDAVERVGALVAEAGLDALIPVGGEGTLTASRMLGDGGVPVVGVPKTVDNDVAATDVTVGFDTAVSVATAVVDRLRTSSEAHPRVMVVEVTGRHAGWVALHCGIAGGAHGIVVPERPFDVDDVCRMVEARFARGRTATVVVTAEGAHPAPGSMAYQVGAMDQYGHERFSGIGQRLAAELEHRIGKEARPVIIGYAQRGGTPTASDRVVAARFGRRAVEAVHKGEFGTMTALRGTDVWMVPLADAVAGPKTVPEERCEETGSVF